LGDLHTEFLPLFVGVCCVEGLQEAIGVAVEGLTREAVLLGLPGNSAVGPVKDSGSVGDAERWG
jgi:hypothetical protein